MANITQNRINQTVTAADLTAISAAITTIQNKLPFLIALTDEERASLSGLDVDNKVFVDETLSEANQNGTVLPAFVTPALLANDIKLFEQLSDIESSLRNLLNKVSDTRRVAAHEAFSLSTVIYNLFKMASDAGIPNARQSYERLRERFRITNPQGRQQDNQL